MAEQPFQLEGVAEQLLLPLPPAAHLAQAGLHIQRGLQRKVLALLGRGVEFGDPVGLAIREFQGAPDVLDGLFALERAERDDLGDAVLAVFLLDVADDLVAPLVAEVDVDVGHALAPRVEETLEQQLIADRVDVGDLQRVRDQAAGRGAASRPDRDALRLGVADEVGHDQKIAGEAHLPDDVQLVRQTVLVRLLVRGVPIGAGAQLGETLLQAGARGPIQTRVEGLAGLDVVGGKEEVVAEGQFQRAPAGHVQGGGDGLRAVGELDGHFLRRLDVQLVGAELPAFFVGHHLGALHAQEHLVRLGVLRAQIVAIVRADQRQRHFACELDERGIDLFLLGQVVGLDFDVEAVVEDRRVCFGRGERPLAVVAQHGARQLAAQAARQRDDAAVEFAQQVVVHARLAVEAFGKTGRHQPAQVAITLLIHGEQDEMEIAAVLQIVGAGRLFVETALGRHVHLAADDRLDPVAGRGAVEVDRAEHVPVVRDRHRGHAGLGDARHEVRDLVGPVEQAVLRVHMQMDEAHPSLSFPLDGCRRFGRHVVHHAIDAAHLVDDAVGKCAE